MTLDISGNLRAALFRVSAEFSALPGPAVIITEMAELFHITEVAEFTESEFAAMSAAYDSAMAGGKGLVHQQIDHEDGSYTLLGKDGEFVGFGCHVDIPQSERTGDVIGDIERGLRKKADAAGCLHDWHYPQDWRVVVCRKCGDCRGDQISFDGFVKHYTYKFNQHGITLRLTGPLPINLSSPGHQGEQNAG